MYILRKKIKYNSRIYLIFSIFLFLFYFYFTPTAYSSNVEFYFHWDANHPNDNVVEYRIYWRTVTGVFDQQNSQVIPISNLLDPQYPEYTLILDVSDPTSIIFACTATDDEGFESDYAYEGDTGNTNHNIAGNTNPNIAKNINPNIGIYESGGGCFVSTVSH